MRVLSTIIITAITFHLCGCGATCNDPSVVAAKLGEQSCQKMSSSYDSFRKEVVHTWACSTSSGTQFRDFVMRDGKLCHIGSESM